MKEQKLFAEAKRQLDHAIRVGGEITEHCLHAADCRSPEDVLLIYARGSAAVRLRAAMIAAGLGADEPDSIHIPEAPPKGIVN